jgi:hypothetical protein
MAEQIVGNKMDVATRTKANKDFSTGIQGRQVTAFNTAIDHLSTMDKLSDALQNNDIKAFNYLGNVVARQTGQPAPVNFDAAKQIVTAEIIKAVVASGGGVQFVSQANDPQAAWMITPVGGDMVRVQQAVGNQWAALGVDPRDIQGFGNGVLAQRGARAQIRFSAVNNSVAQLWRIEQQFGGGYCFESVAMPGFGMTCIPNQGLWLQPLVYSPWQIWWAQQPSFTVSMPQYRIANEQIVPNPPLGPISLRVANTHSEAIVVLLADRRNPNAPRKLRIPAGGSEVLVL